MARPGLDKHPKFRRLCTLLKVAKPHARGYLELLWDVAYENGDPVIGDELDVALATEFPGEPKEITAALLNCGGGSRAGFIEEVPDRPGTYQVHDLFDHAPEYVGGRSRREAERKRDKVCEHCGVTYRNADPRSKYCSPSCRTLHWRDGGTPPAAGVDGVDGPNGHRSTPSTPPPPGAHDGVAGGPGSGSKPGSNGRATPPAGGPLTDANKRPAPRIAEPLTDVDGPSTDVDTTPAPAPAPAPALAPEEKSRGMNPPTTPSCSEPGKPASEPADGDIVLTYPIVGKGPKTWPLTGAKVREYAEAFPGVDVVAECRKALLWCRDNPTKRKTARGMPRLLAGWLGKAQDRAGAAGQSRLSPTEQVRQARLRMEEKQRSSAERVRELMRQDAGGSAAPPAAAAGVVAQPVARLPDPATAAAWSVVQHYQLTVRPAWPHDGAIEAVAALLAGGAAAEQLKRAAEGYAAECGRNKTEAKCRKRASNFYGAGGAYEGYLG